MPNIRDIRRRIRSAKNIQQITRAMKFVSTVRLRKAQDRVLAARPYARQMSAVLNSLAARVPGHKHPLLAQRGDHKIELVVVTADKGLCGSYNTNVIKRAVEFLAEHPGKQVELNAVGRRGRDFFRRRSFPLRRAAVNVLHKLAFEDAVVIARDLIEQFERGEQDQVWILYNEFRSAVHQRPVVERLLPIERAERTGWEQLVDYLYSEPPAQILDRLLPRYVETQVFHALLEAAAAEQGARMTAMDAATKNASEMIDNLTMFANKVRQAGITKELIEVVSGAASTQAEGGAS